MVKYEELSESDREEVDEESFSGEAENIKQENRSSGVVKH
jgi:hypothetical protein